MNQPLKTLSLLVFFTLVCVSLSYASPKTTTKDKDKYGYTPPANTGTPQTLASAAPKPLVGVGKSPEPLEVTPTPPQTVTPIPLRVCEYVHFQGVTIDVTRWDPEDMHGQSDLFGSCPPGYRCLGQGKCQWQYGEAGANRVIYEGDPACTYSSQDCTPRL